MKYEVNDNPTLSVRVKRGILYGAALGMLVGLIYQAFFDLEGRHPIIVWRDFIIAGAAVGLVFGLIVGAFRRPNPTSPKTNPSEPDSRRDTEKES